MPSVDRTVARRRRKPPAQRPKVLLVMRPNGFIEARSNVALDFRAVQVLDTAPEGERLAESYAELLAPRSHRGLPLRATALVERVTVADEAERRFTTSLVKELVNIGRGPVRPPAAIQRARRAKG